MTERLPLYMDRATCQRLLGLTRVDVDRIFRACPVHALEGSRKVYVATEDALERVHKHPRDAIRRSWEAA